MRAQPTPAHLPSVDGEQLFMTRHSTITAGPCAARPPTTNLPPVLPRPTSSARMAVQLFMRRQLSANLEACCFAPPHPNRVHNPQPATTPPPTSRAPMASSAQLFEVPLNLTLPLPQPPLTPIAILALCFPVPLGP